jgi:AraC-like DNA-binding protein
MSTFSAISKKISIDAFKDDEIEVVFINGTDHPNTINVMTRNCVNLCINIAGFAQIRSAGKDFELRPYQYELINPKDEEISIAIGSGKCSMLVINIPLAFMIQFQDQFDEIIREHISGQQEGPLRTFGDVRYVTREMETTINLLSSFESKNKELERIVLSQMVVSLILCCFQTAQISERKIADSTIEFAERLLSVEYSKAWTADLLADTVGIHKKTLNTRFRKVYTQSPMRYLYNLRLEKAMELLAVKGATIDKVARHLGYKYTYDFTRAFQKRYGYSPTQIVKDFPNPN